LHRRDDPDAETEGNLVATDQPLFKWVITRPRPPVSDVIAFVEDHKDAIGGKPLIAPLLRATRAARCANAWFVLDAMEQAVHQRQPGSGLTHHLNCGSRYLSIKYTQRLSDAGMDPSGGCVSDRYDNALAETINRPTKAEVTTPVRVAAQRRRWGHATLEWVDGFNNRRMLQPVETIPPAKAQAKVSASLARANIDAQIKKPSRKLRVVHTSETRRLIKVT